MKPKALTECEVGLIFHGLFIVGIKIMVKMEFSLTTYGSE